MSDNVSRGGKKAWIAVVSVFVAGIIVGGLLTAVLIRNHVIHIMRHDRPPLHEIVAGRLTVNLDLSSDQRAQLDGILAEYGPRFDQFDRSSRNEMRTMAEEMETRIREILTPEQRVRYDANIAQMRERFERRKPNH